MNLKIAIVALVKLEQDKLLRYNPQSVGLAKALASRGAEVDVYSFEQLEGTSKTVTDIAPNVTLIQQDCPSLGRNTIQVTKYLSTGYNCVICFSDIQMAYCGLDHWCRKNQIPLFPYVGVIQSSSENRIARNLMGLVAKRNLEKYRSRLVFAKTLPVKEALEKESVSTVLAPVGLDVSYLKDDFSGCSAETCKQELGFGGDDSVLLFVGRLVDEKRPLELIDLFRRIHSHDKKFKLCIVGDGHLRPAMLQKISEFNLTDKVRHYPLVKNSEMWKFYHMADFSINLNLAEIFGMSILEAMYYKTLVVARRAPGPEMIIEHKEDGYLCDSDDEIFETVTAPSHQASVDRAHRKIVEDFDWTRTSETMLNTIQEAVRTNGVPCT